MPRGQGAAAPRCSLSGDFAAGARWRMPMPPPLKTSISLLPIAPPAFCYEGLRQILKDNEERKNICEYADKIKDITEFLVDILKLPTSAYHAAPEYRGKTAPSRTVPPSRLRVKEQPRVSSLNLSRDKVEMPEADCCCGMAGAFSIYYYELSKNIGQESR